MSRDDLALTAAFLVAMAATLGALFIGEVLGQMPCTLCWYQRIAMFPLVPILGLPIPYLSAVAFAAILACLILPKGHRT